MKKLLISAALMLLAVPTLAGDKVLNGGDAVVCYTDPTRTKIKSVRMFDYWEQENVLHYPGGLDLGGATLSVQDKITKVTNRMAKFDPDLAEQVKTVALFLANNINSYLVTSAQLPEIDDANPKVIPNEPNCFIEQYAVQKKDLVTGERRFLIADKFYNHVNTSNNHKAGLLLHEAIYRYAILNGASNSDGVRFYNYVVATAKIDGLNLDQTLVYLNIINDAKMNFNQCELNLDHNLIVFVPSAPSNVDAIVCYNTRYKGNNDRLRIDLGQNTRVRSMSLSYLAFDRQDGNILGDIYLWLNQNWVIFKVSELTLHDKKTSFYTENTTESFMNTHFKMIAPLGVQVPCSGNYISLAEDYDVTWCYPKNGEFPVGNQVLKTSFYVQKDIRNNHFQYTLDDLQDNYTLPVAGSQHNLTVTLIKNLNDKPETGDVLGAILNSQGQVTVAGNMLPIDINFNGTVMTAVKYFQIYEGKLRVRAPILLTAVNNKYISNLPYDKTRDKVVELCEKLGHEDSYLDQQFTLKKYYVGNTENYIQIETGLTVAKTDEYVQRISDIQCLTDYSTENY